MPDKPTRSLSFRLRLSPAEKATLDERARAAGLKVAEFLRREAGIGHFGRADLRRPPFVAPAVVRPEPGHTAPENQAADHARRVNIKHQRMSRRNAEAVVSREEASERAKAALGS